jgi:hypothetical protein
VPTETATPELRYIEEDIDDGDRYRHSQDAEAYGGMFHKKRYEISLMIV